MHWLPTCCRQTRKQACAFDFLSHNFAKEKHRENKAQAWSLCLVALHWQSITSMPESEASISITNHPPWSKAPVLYSNGCSNLPVWTATCTTIWASWANLSKFCSTVQLFWWNADPYLFWLLIWQQANLCTSNSYKQLNWASCRAGSWAEIWSPKGHKCASVSKLHQTPCFFQWRHKQSERGSSWLLHTVFVCVTLGQSFPISPHPPRPTC